METNVGIPKIPKHVESLKKIKPPDSKLQPSNNTQVFEHSWQLVIHLIASGIRNLPKLALTMLLPLAIVTVVNIILHSIPTYTLVGFSGTLVFILIFLTSSYNSMIPRAIFWVIILTFGKTLFRRVRSEGLTKVLTDYQAFPSSFMNVRKALGSNGNYVLSIGVGLGFFMANFLSRNNRLDKVLVCYVVAIALINALSKGKEGMVFIAIKLIYKDLVGILKNAKELTGDQIYMCVSGLVLGLIGNTIFGVIKLSYGGYILGLILVVLGTVMLVINKKEVKSN